MRLLFSILTIFSLHFNSFSQEMKNEDLAKNIRNNIRGKVFSIKTSQGSSIFLKFDELNEKKFSIKEEGSGERNFITDNFTFLSSYGLLLFDFYEWEDKRLFGKGSINLDADVIEVKNYNLSTPIVYGKYYLTDPTSYEESFGLFSKNIPLLDCAEKEVLSILCNNNIYLFLYTNKTADIITYTHDSKIYNHKTYQYHFGGDPGYGPGSKDELYIGDEVYYVRFVHNSKKPLYIISYKSRLKFSICDEKEERDFINKNIKIFGATSNKDYVNNFTKSGGSYLKGTKIIRTPIEILKQRPEEIINIFNYFYNKIQPDQRNSFYEKNQNPFKVYNFKTYIDETNNIIFLEFQSKGSMYFKEIYAMHPLLGPLEFVRTDSLINIFDIKTYYKPTQDLNQFNGAQIVLEFNSSTSTGFAHSLRNSLNGSILRDNMNLSINNSYFYLREKAVGKKSKTFAYYPSFEEKLAIYKSTNALTLSNVNNNNFYIIKTEEESLYKYFISTVTDINPFISNYIQGIFPLDKNRCIFKFENKYGILDLSNKNWKDQSFILVDNVYDKIIYLKKNVLKGILQNSEIYFDYEGNELAKPDSK